MPEVHCSNSSSRPGLTRREATAVTGGSSPLPGSRYSSSSFKEDTPMACTIPPIKSQAFAGDHPTPGQKSRVTPKGDGMNEGAVHLQRRSKQLTRSTVSAVLKEASCVSGSDCIERLAHSLN